ncbi:hypothetical protein ACFQUU_21600 [Herbaspirillum sp. GCM10030257]|uniref:AbiTii domain-containing protein n=1 Tax=Herbaspirillum sp. GCM10030257 TaxID=3273393 RepID=UPI00360E6557
MSAIVHELTNMASDPSIATTDLLRRALVVARRLEVPDLITWINSELSGYRQSEVPDYRRVQGQLVAENPYRGPIPFMPPAEMAELLSDFSIRQSVPELAKVAESTTGIYSHFPPEVEQILMRMMQEGSGVAMRPALRFSVVQVQGVIEIVRSRILDWALDLESRGIIGDGMTFTQEEKNTVQQQHYHFGNVSGSQIQIGSHESTQSQTNSNTNDVEALRGFISAFETALSRSSVTGEAVEEMRAELATLKAQASSPKPKWEIIKATARSLKTIAEGAMGNVLGELAKPHFGTLMSLASS